MEEQRGSNMNRVTIKEIRRWMKTLEENRYRKIVNADARRVAWLVNNNLAEDYDMMPKTIRKKWPQAQYGKERYLAKKFMESKKAKLKENAEQKLREVIKETIRGILSEKTTTFQMKTPDMKKVDMLLKKGKFKGLNMKSKGPKFTLTVPKKMEDEVLSYLIQKGITDINEV